MVKKATDTKTKDTTGTVKHIDIMELLPNPYQPESRAAVNPETAKKFALSIQEHGLIQMPVVRFILGEGKVSQEQVVNGHYEIADGWLRRSGFLCNLVELGLQEYATMPCVERKLTDQQMADMVMEANTVRKDLNVIELAKFYQRYLEDFKIPQAELARRHNCSQGEIANTIRLLDLPEDIQGKIISQEITETHGRQLLRLNNSGALQQEVLTETIKEGRSVDKLSNDIAQKIWWNSVNLDPSEYPKPMFDTAGCEGCPNRQKIGRPYSNEKKTWRCLDKACFLKKTDEAENERVAKLAKEIAKAKAKAGDDKGAKGAKGAKGVGVIDCTDDKMTWRDYQELDSYKKIDNPEQCKTCEHRAIGKFYNGRTGPICTNVKCFQAKEKALQAKEAAESRKAEQELSQQVKAVCENVSDEASMVRVISAFLLGRCNKDPREKFMRLYGVTDMLEYFTATEKVDMLPRLAALVLQIERYQGEKGRFVKMLADLSGTGAALDKQLADFKEAHCKTCQYNEAEGGCSILIRVYIEDKCYRYIKVKKVKEEEKKEVEAQKSENEELMEALPCEDCQNAPTCDRSFFHDDGQDGYVCENKVSGAREEEVAKV